MSRANRSDRRVIDLVKNLVNLPRVKMTVEGVRVIRRITRADCLKHTGVDLEVLWSEHWGHGNNQVFLYDEPVCANCHSPYTNHGPNHPYGESTLCWGCRADDAAEDRNLTLPPRVPDQLRLARLACVQSSSGSLPHCRIRCKEYRL